MQKSHDPDSLVLAYQIMQDSIEKGQFNVVEQISQICQSVMWGDKNNDTFFDYFCDKNTLQTYYELIQKIELRDVIVSVIKSLTMLLQNIQKQTSVNYILSHPAFNKIVIAEYNFQDDEIIAYYINLLKCVSIRIDESNIQLFFNLKFSTFPMLMRAISFFGHKENLIRTSVRNIVLGITKINHPPLKRYVRHFPFALFFVQFSAYMKEQIFHIEQQITEGFPQSQKIIKMLLDDQLDILYFLEDLLKLNQDGLNLIINAIFGYGLIPSIFMSLLPPKVFTYQHNAKQRIGIKFLLYTLIQVYKSFTFPEFLDLLTLMLLGRDSKIVDFVINQNRHSRLQTYTQNMAMSQVWEKQQQFMQTYAQYVYKNGCIDGETDLLQSIQQTQCQENTNIFHKMNLEFFQQLIVDDDKYIVSELQEEIGSITDVLEIELVPNNNNNNNINNDNDLGENQRPPLNLMRFFLEGNQLRIGKVLDFNEEDEPVFFHQLMNHFNSQDDTVVFMLLLFIKTLRHSKNISHNILTHIGLITPDKNLQMYQQCRPTREYLQDQILKVLKVGSPPFRLGTIFLSVQMLLDISRVDLEDNNHLSKERLQKIAEITIKCIQTIREELQNPVEFSFIVDFFMNEYRVFNKNTISIWPQAHMQLLFPMSQAGQCQIDPKHNESLYFIEPTQLQDRVRRDLVVLLLLKYLVQIIFKFNEEQKKILNDPKPIKIETVEWQVGQIYDLSLPNYGNRRVYKCRMKYRNVEYPTCIVIEDEQCIVIMEIKEHQCTVVLFKNLKYTDEIIQKLNLKMLHISYKNKDQMDCFDLEFKDKLICQDVKQFIQKKKNEIKKQEMAIINLYLDTLQDSVQLEKL